MGLFGLKFNQKVKLCNFEKAKKRLEEDNNLVAVPIFDERKQEFKFKLLNTLTQEYRDEINRVKYLSNQGKKQDFLKEIHVDSHSIINNDRSQKNYVEGYWKNANNNRNNFSR